jgi:acetyl-CoA carboxylase carboxyltransferase component
MLQKKLEALKPDMDAVKQQHAKGKLTAEERLALLLDKNSFVELDIFAETKSKDALEKRKPRDGVITGYGTIESRPVYVFAQDFTYMGGSMGETHNRKIARVMELALKNGCPCIGLYDSGGARIQEGVAALDSGGRIFKLNMLMSGIVPQFSLILGPCAGIAVYSPALTDFVLMSGKAGSLFITGPEVVKASTGESITLDTLGGAGVHSEKSGVVHIATEDEKQCIKMLKLLLSYVPQNNLEQPPAISLGDSATRMNKTIQKIVPQDSRKPYDMKAVITDVMDKHSFLEVHALYARNAIVGFARLGGKVVGVVANQPAVLAGCLDIHSSDKIARFVRFCDSFNIPLVSLVDVAGYLPGKEQEHNGVIRHGSKILYAFAEATVPKISLILRKAYGGAFIALASKELGYDMVLAWPHAEIAVMGPEQAVTILHHKELQGKNAEKLRKEKITEYEQKFLNPYHAASSGQVDMVIFPEETRKSLIMALQMLSQKRESIVKERKYRKHGNMPL